MHVWLPSLWCLFLHCLDRRWGWPHHWLQLKTWPVWWSCNAKKGHLIQEHVQQNAEHCYLTLYDFGDNLHDGMGVVISVTSFYNVLLSNSFQLGSEIPTFWRPDFQIVRFSNGCASAIAQTIQNQDIFYPDFKWFMTNGCHLSGFPTAGLQDF